MKNIQSDKMIQQDFEKEFEEMITFFTSGNKSKKKGSGSLMRFQRMVKKLATLVDPTDMILSKEMSIQGIRMFRKMIELEIPNLTSPSIDWKDEDYSESLSSIKILQDKFVEYDVVSMVVNMISIKEVDISLKLETILLIGALLIGGNQKA